MIEKVVYKEGDIIIDNSELLGKRADMSNEPREQELVDNEGIGGIRGKEEETLKRDFKSVGWKEARKATDVKHVCPVCATRYWARPNKNYCSERCKNVAKKRRQRKRKRDIRDFKPHRGTAGEIYIMCDVKGKQVISFVPAFHTENCARAKQYIKDTYPEDVRDNYMEQVKEVLKK